MAKFIEEKYFDDYEVLTPNGWKDFKGIGKTVPYDVWNLLLEDGTILKAADDHIVITGRGGIRVKELCNNDSVETQTGPVKVKSVENTGKIEHMYDLLDVDGSIYYTNGVASHNSTVIATYALWYAIFNNDKSIGIVSNKEKAAIDILHRVRIMYEELPAWLKPGVTEYSKTFVAFDNGSRIDVSATSPDAFRGRSLNLLVADEFAFVKKNIADEFWAANYPTISASEEAKIIVISTPNGMFNLFHKLYMDAEHGENTFIPLKFDYRAVPGRDHKWAEEQRKNLGKVKFAQEQLVEFIGSIATVVDPTALDVLFKQVREPEIRDMKGKFFVYEKPEKGCVYVIGVDSAKGTGENYSVCQVLKITSLKPPQFEQVAVWASNTLGVYEFADVVDRLSIYYNNAYIMCENNSEGSTVVNRLWWDLENSNLVNSGNKQKDLGVRAAKNTKPRAVLLMKKILEDSDLRIRDIETVNQLASFIEKRPNVFGGKDTADDYVSALYWSLYILEMNILEEGYEVKKMTEGKNEDDVWGVMSDVESVEEDWKWLTDYSIQG